MTARGAALIGRAEPDRGFTTDQSWLRQIAFPLTKGLANRVRIMTIHRANHLPAIGFKSGRGIIGKPTANRTINRNAIVIIQTNQLTQPKRAGQRAGFMRNPLHQTTIAGKDVGMMINNVEGLTIRTRLVKGAR